MSAFRSRHRARCCSCSDFVAARSKDEIREIFASIGHELTDYQFERVWERVRPRVRSRAGVLLSDAAHVRVLLAQAATHYDLNSNGIVSVEEFRLALNEFEDAMHEGYVPEWAA